jgi:membrane protein DedA with SNARE-associated domain
MIALECLGLPLPGEAVLIIAAVYAGQSHDLPIVNVLAAAVIGGVVGNIGGYWLGREYGYRLLIRYGAHIRLTEPRIKIGRYLFRQHGFTVVLLARFVAVLRSVAGILAGANHMPLPPFLVASVLGGLAWVGLYGVGGYWFGGYIHRLAAPVGVALAVIAVIAIIYVTRAIARREHELVLEAERAFPGPLSDSTS